MAFCLLLTTFCASAQLQVVDNGKTLVGGESQMILKDGKYILRLKTDKWNRKTGEICYYDFNLGSTKESAERTISDCLSIIQSSKKLPTDPENVAAFVKSTESGPITVLNGKDKLILRVVDSYGKELMFVHSSGMKGTVSLSQLVDMYEYFGKKYEGRRY